MPEAARRRLDRWATDAGRALLERLARRPGSLRALSDAHGVAFWERAILRRALVARREGEVRGGRPAGDRRAWVERLARELDLLRAQEQRLAAAHPFPRQRAFRGNRAHLTRLERSVAVPVPDSEWNDWRRRARGIRPDLRGADLSGLKLNHLDLGKARLAGGNLSGARLFRAPDADLRRARLVGTDLGAADLGGADLREALLRGTNLTDANLANATLCDANLIDCALNRTLLRGADLRRALVWGASAWDADYDDTTRQADLFLVWDGLDPIDDYDWRAMRRAGGCMRVDNLGLAQIMALVKRQPRSLGELFKEVSNKMVLLLGRFSGRHARALAILEEGLAREYIPVRFDFQTARDEIDMVAVLAGLCRFIVADFSDARSVLIEAQRIIPAFTVPFVPILERGAGEVVLFDTLRRKYPWVVRSFVYTSDAHLRRSLQRKIVRPAELTSARLRQLMR